MNNNLTTPFSSLLATIYTREEAEKIQDILSEMRDELYKIHHDPALDALIGKLPSQVSEVLQQLLAQKKIVLQTPQEINKFCDEFSQTLKSTDALSLNMAFEPSYELTQKIAGICKNELGDNTLLEFKIDPRILGGALISFKGQYFDYSLKTKLDHFLKA